jgi:hypothetical protein
MGAQVKPASPTRSFRCGRATWASSSRATAPAPVRAARALERGPHVGMLVDQHFTQGVDVTFFGRRCNANPLIARLARHFDCPIRGIRAIRLPRGSFRLHAFCRDGFAAVLVNDLDEGEEAAVRHIPALARAFRQLRGLLVDQCLFEEARALTAVRRMAPSRVLFGQ